MNGRGNTAALACDVLERDGELLRVAPRAADLDARAVAAAAADFGAVAGERLVVATEHERVAADVAAIGADSSITLLLLAPLGTTRIVTLRPPSSGARRATHAARRHNENSTAEAA